MTRRHKLAAERARRLEAARNAADSIEERGKRVDGQISLVARLTEGWRKVHERNHLAQLFRDEGKLG
jgi:hypothetical protein